MKKNPPMTNSTITEIRVGADGSTSRGAVRAMKTEPISRAEFEGRSINPARLRQQTDSARPDATRTRTFERIAENSSGSMRKTREPMEQVMTDAAGQMAPQILGRARKTSEPMGRMNKRKDDLYKPD